MAIERTISIIKPDAVSKNVIGKIYDRFESNGLKIVAAKMKHLTREEAEAFYAVHKERPFFNDLVAFMVSGPVMVQVLEGENAVAKIVRLWVRPIRKMLWKERFVKISPMIRVKMQCMVPIVWKMQKLKLTSSLIRKRFMYAQ